MASITLKTLWLTNAADLTDSQSFPLLSKLTATPTIGGAIRRYASGRFRAIAQAGDQNQLAATLPTCDPDQVAWIDAMAGQLLMVRDDRGRKFYGQYFTYQADEHAYDGNTDVTLTVAEVSHSEAV
jgi:hypothetical protein